MTLKDFQKFVDYSVDPQRIELWSKQALNALSTCVADY